MRSRWALAAVTLALLAACGSDPASPGSDQAAPSAAASPPGQSAAPPESARQPEIEGLEVLAEDPGHDHVQGQVEYDRTPPLGGPHNPRWLACDVYDEAVPTELAVHSIEHGAIWITYRPDLPADQVAMLAELAASNREYVLVSPLDGLDSRIVAVSWGLGLEASSADDPRLQQLVDGYAGGGQGGEPGAPCRSSGLTLREAQGQLGSSA